MEVKIGVQNSPRELVLEVDGDAESIAAQVSEAVANNGVLSLSDTKGRTTIVPTAGLAYVELGSSSTGSVGFLR